MDMENLNHWKMILETLNRVNEETAPSVDMSKIKPTDDPDEVRYFLPTIKITEDWGKIGSKDRQIIEKFTRNIGGNTLQEKIRNINSVITDREATTIPKILGSMVVIEILNAVLREFTESAGGFIFEGFLAGLFGGESVQITDVGDQAEAGEATEAAGKPITDVVLGGREYSLKLLGKTTAVKGSFKNMVEHFRVKDHIVYLDARRTKADGDLSGLEFGEFVITRENFMQVFMDPFLKDVTAKSSQPIDTPKGLRAALEKLESTNNPLKKLAWSGAKWNKIGSIEYGKPRASAEPEQLDEKKFYGDDFSKLVRQFLELPDEDLQKYAPFTLSWADKKFEGTKAEKLFGSFTLASSIKQASEAGDTDKLLQLLATTPGYTESLQFDFTRGQAESIVNFQEIGTLNISEQTLKDTWLAYGEVLSNSVEPIYKALNAFNTNINSFLTEEQNEDGNRKQYGLAAGTSAKELKTATDKAVQEITAAEESPSE